ncbi:MAG: hypothetical protein A2V70_18330 [Planctomycetes bacterium RBG_13_63_9]|nr:MAG: hypothetical protein A2V70_18330 [Planctomycetes bacterium RBG_13_63_9]
MSDLSQKVTMSLGYISQRDGAQNTLLLSEGILTPAGAAAERTWTASGTPPLPPPEDVLGFMWGMADDETDLNMLRMTCANPEDPQPENPQPGLGNLSSRHGTGVVVGFCGGNVRWLEDSIHYRVYQHLMTPDSKEANVVATLLKGGDPYDGNLNDDDPNVKGVLNESDF